MKHLKFTLTAKSLNLILLTLLLFCLQPLQAQVATLTGWTNVFHGTGNPSATVTVPAGTGNYRVLVVGVATSQTTIGSRTITATYGGQTLTLANGDLTNTLTRQHTAIYYLPESGINAAANTTLSLTITGGTTRVNDVWVTVLDNVNQASPVTNSQVANNLIAGGSLSFSTGLAVNTNDQAVEVVSTVNAGNTTPRTITYATNWTLSNEQTFTTTDGVRNGTATRSIPVANVAADVSTTTFDAAALASMTGVSFKSVTIYRSAASGNWNSTATWQQSTNGGTTWTVATSTPTDANGPITIQNGHTVTVTAAVTADELTVNTGGQITVNTGITFTLANGAGTDLSLSGTFSNAGTLTATGTISVLAGGTYIHNQNGGTIPTATWNATSTVQVDNVTSTIPGGLTQSFGNFVWNSANTTAMSTAITAISGNLTIQNGSTGTFLLPNLTIPGNLTISGTANVLMATAANRTTSVTGSFSMSGGTLTLSNGTAIGTLNVNGDFSHTGGTITESSTGSGAINFSGTTLQLYTGGGTVTNTINYTVNSNAILGFATATDAITGGGNFTLSSGATLQVSAVAGVTSSGASGQVQVTGTRTFNAAANYVYNGTSAQVIGNGWTTGNNLTINNAAGVTLSGNTIANGTVTLTAGQLSAGAGNFNLTVGGNWVNNGGSYAGGSGKVIMSGATGTIGGTSSTSFAGLTIDAGSAYTLNNSNSAVTLVVGDTATAGASSLTLSNGTTLSVSGSAYICRPGGAATNALNVNAATVTVSGDLIFAGTSTSLGRIASLVLTTGTVTVSTNIVYQTNASAGAGSNLISITGAGTINLAGDWTGTTGTLTANTSSNFNYNGTAAQTVRFFTGNYGNLQINNTNSSGATLEAAITATNLTGNLLVGNSASGSLLNTNNLAVALANTKVITVSAGSTLDAGTTSIAMGTGATVTINGTFKTANTNGFSGSGTTAVRNTNTPTITLGANSLVEYNSGSAQTVTGITYSGNLTLSGAGTKTLGGAATVAKTITLGGGALALSTFNLTVNGNLAINAAISGTGAVVISGGTALHTFTGTGSFTNLTLSDAGFNTSLSADLTVNGVLTLTNGLLITGAQRVIVPTTASISRTNGYVHGNLRMFIPNTGSPTILFPIGDLTNYAPVSIAFTGTTSGSGYLDASTVAAQPPLASGLSQSKYINRKWVIENTGVAGFTSYAPTFTYTAADQIGTPVTALLQARKLTGATWSVPVLGTVTGTTLQATGITSFSEFYIGEAQQVSNAILDENALPGNPSTEWDITGAGDLSIQGFATNMSVNKGDAIDFKINVTDASSYTIKIYRLGYYQGNGARLIADLGTFSGTVQPSPVTNTTLGLVDCGNWTVSATWNTPATAVSGVYIAKLTKVVGGGSSHITFVVRDDAGNSDLLFKTSDATWQAYNIYGGYSFYAGTTAYTNGRAAKISYNRPLLTRNGGGGGQASEDFVFNAEYPMIRWLERNGYNVSYVTDVDMERDATAITPSVHKAIISVGHDEYWSAAARTRVTNARNAGVHLAFFSGNEVYWKTRWENSVDGNNTPNRTLVCYKEGSLGENACGGKCDPLTNVWTGLWRDGSAFPAADGNAPENALTGQVSWGNATGAMVVPATVKDFRFWRNTTITGLGSGGSATLSNNTLGYEFDYEQQLYKSTYPAGRVGLSQTTLTGKMHKLSLYRYNNNAFVFGAGTVQWSWGLDGVHDRGASTPDPRMQQATVNLFGEMGVQPASLQAGLTIALSSNDNTPPSSSITSHISGASINTSTAITLAGTATESGGGVIAGVEVSTDNGVTWNTATGTTSWTYNWLPAASGTYTVLVRSYDDLGNVETTGTVPAANAISLSVTISLPTCPCTIFPTNVPPVPANTLLNDITSIEVGTKFRSTADGYITAIRFYKPSNTGVYTVNLWDSATQQKLNFMNVSNSATGWIQVTFGSPVAIQANKTYIATYYSSSGDYASTDNYFTTAITNGYLTALQDEPGKPNGVYHTGSPGFPTQFYTATSYWVDPVFVTSIPPDVTPPTIITRAPLANSQNVGLTASISAVFSESIDSNSVSTSSFVLFKGATPIPATVVYHADTRTAVLTPVSQLDYNSTYTVTVKGGIAYNTIMDEAGNHLASSSTWSFTTKPAPPPPADQGNGGSILVISSNTNKFSRYYTEILRAEGLNGFYAQDISLVTVDTLNKYDIVILGEISLSAGQVTLLTNWVNAGGTLVTFRPDAQLYSLLGITNAGGTLSNKYLLINTTAGTPGAGIVNQSIQFHGTASQYTLNGATALGTLYSDANTATAYPAVTINSVGSNHGKAIAFAYDLARSVVYTRQGNPAWAGQKRDGSAGPVRSDDLFFGNASGDPQPDWVDFNKIQIPQADEQQHLLSNIITINSNHRKPLPRVWILPRKLKATVVMTGDDHGNAGTIGRFNQYLAFGNNSAQDVLDWKAIRGTSYIYPITPISDSLAAAFTAMGFEISMHLTTDCNNYDSTALKNYLDQQLQQFTTVFPSLPTPTTNRTHCIAWADWASKPKVEILSGIRLNTDYYYWPNTFVQNRPGLFTGSGMPMRFADLDGSIIDNYQATSQFTDESGVTYPAFAATLFDNAIGSKGYYGVFTANMHTDFAVANDVSTIGSNAIVNAAISRSIPVVSARQMLTWLDGRNNTVFSNMVWNVNTFTFTLTAGVGAHQLQAMLPVQVQKGSLTGISLNGSPVAYTTETIKGIDYAFFDGVTGNYTATYSVDNTAPVISGIAAVPNIDGTATVTWTTDEASNSRVDFGTSAGSLTQFATDGSYVTSHVVTLTGLTPGITYYFRVTSVDPFANSSTSPLSPAAPATVTMPGTACFLDQLTADFSLGTTGANTYISTMADGEVKLKPAAAADFATLPSQLEWKEFPWVSGVSTTTITNGKIIVDGARFNSEPANVTYSTGSVLEFVATFEAMEGQHIGLSGGTDAVTLGGLMSGSDPWILIGTANRRDSLLTRVFNGTSITEHVLPGNYFGIAHKYKIAWKATTIEFYIDDVLMHTETVTLATQMRPVISDFYFGPSDLTVDWIHLTPYPASGTYTSHIYDGGSLRNWENVLWSATVPVGTALKISYRRGNTPDPDATWTNWDSIPANNTVLGKASQYIQYKADLSTTNSTLTPVLNTISISCSLATNALPATTVQPQSQIKCEADTTRFISKALGFPNPTIQWQVSADNGITWNAIAGAITDTLQFVPSAADHNKKYRAIWSNTAGNDTSAVATLTVNVKPVVAIGVLADTVCYGNTIGLRLNSATGLSPYSITVNGRIYTGVTVGQTFATLHPLESTIWDNTSTPAVANQNDGTGKELGVKFRSAVNGKITGIRFYKGALNTGTHTGTLWNSSGTALATATFSSETASGWQEVRFSTPVSITANTTYIASYFSPAGVYGLTSNGLTSSVTNGSLTALASGTDGVNGVINTGAGFPSAGTNNNYWVDVLFEPVEVDPVTKVFKVTSVTDNNSCTSASDSLTSTKVVVNPLPTGTLGSASAVTCNGSAISLVFTQGAGSNAGPFTLVINGQTYNNITSGVPFLTGNNANFNPGPYTLFDTTSTSNNFDPDNLNIEVGFKFKPLRDGLISGIRFYKKAGNTTTHIGSLWSSTGTLLATATFANETASGWQQVSFSTPVAVTAGTTYVASYFSAIGGYAYTAGVFTDSVLNPSSTLTGLKGTVGSPNGVYKYNASSIFPDQGSASNTSYMVDVLFTPSSGVAAYNLTSITSAAGCTTTGAPISTVSVVIKQVDATVSITNVACNAGNTGAVTLTGINGTAPYTYRVGAGAFQNSGAFTGLTAGTYTFRIKDATDCFKDTTVTITEPAAIATTLAITNATCFGSATGAVTLTPTGGTGAYQYSKDTGNTYQVSATFSNLLAGNYLLRIKDANNCTKDTAITITQPNAIATTLAIVNATCFGSATGSVTATPTGGTGTYQYSKDTGTTYQPSATFSNLAAGNYLIRIKDANNCTKDTSITIGQPTAVTTTVTITNVDCYGVSNGVVVLAGSGGTGAFTYSKDTGTTYQASGTFNGLPAGTRLFKIKDANNCVKDTVITITQPVQITGILEAADAVTCNGSTINLKFTQTAGTAGSPFTLVINGQTYNNVTSGTPFSSNESGVYSTGPFTIFDTTSVGGNPGNDFNSIEVGVKFKPTVNGRITAIRFYKRALNTGTHIGTLWTAAGVQLATVTFSNETASGWQQAVFSTPVDVTAGTTYVASYFSPNGNYAYTANILADSVVNPSNTLIAKKSTVGDPNGMYRYTATSNFPNTASPTDGSYFVDVVFVPNYAVAAMKLTSITSAAGCTTTGAPISTALVTVKQVAATVNITNATCHGGNNGSLTVTGSGGTAPYTYRINSGSFQSSGTFSGLTAGSYTIRIMDSTNCIKDTLVTVGQPQAITATLAITNATCFGSATGAVTLTTTGGTGPYQFSKDTGNTYQVSATFSSLAAGTYQIRIKDANNCIQDTTFTVTQPNAIAATLAIVNATCFGSATGSVTVTPTGGTGTYQYSKDTGTTYQPSAIFSNLAAGNYLIRIKDANNCTKDTSITVGQPTAVSATVTITNADCFGVSNGSVVLAGTGGTGAFTYSKDTGTTYQASGTFNGLPAGTRLFKIKDANNCVKDTVITITQPVQITGILEAADAVTCNGSTINLKFTQTAGTAGSPFTLVINGQTYNNVTSGTPFSSSETAVLNAGPFTIFDTTSVGGNPGNDFNSIEVGVKFKPTVDGRITAIRFYKRALNTGTHTGTLWTAAGVQLATVTFSNETASGWQQAVFSTPVDVTAGTTYMASYFSPNGNYAYTDNILADSVVNPSSTLIAKKSAVGDPNGMYRYTATSNFPNTASPTNGSYFVDVVFVPNYAVAAMKLTSITSAAGCTTTGAPISTALVTVKQVAATVSITDATCHGGNNGALTVTGSGGTAPYTYRINSGSFQGSGTFSGLTAGSYTVRIKDATDCIKDTLVTVGQPQAITATLAITNATCFGSATGSVTLTTSGGTGPYQFSKDTGNTYQSGTTFSNLAAGTYQIRIKDASNCTTDTVLTVGQPARVAATISITNANCNGVANGSVTLTGTGGTPGYTYSNNNGVSYQASGTFGSLAAGTYQYRIKDANNCTHDTTITITQPAVLSGSLSASSFCTGNQIYITYTAANGTGPFSLVINDSVYTNITSGIPFATGGVATNQPETFFPAAGTGGTAATEINSGGIEVGMKFQSTVAGQITGIRFYKHSINLGVHTGSLWDNNGTLLATVTFTGETLSGWQQALFSSPVTITPGVTYVATYYTPNRGYAYTFNALTAKDLYNANGTLKVLKAGGNGGNGVFRIGSSGFPNAVSGQDANYWVDVVFNNTSQTAKYNLTSITSATGCQASGTPISTVNVAMTGLSLSLTKSVLTCLENTDGSFSVTATGGTAPFQYSKDGGTTFQSGNSFTGLAAGTYSVRVKDATNCTKDTTVVIDVEKATWTGAVSTDWHTAGNWSTNQVPSSTTHVIIPVTANECIISGQDANAASVQVRTGATIRANNNRKLTIAGKCATLPAN